MVGNANELAPEADAIDRFERMVQTQIDTLEGIDDKAAHVTRFVVLLLGVVFTGLSLIPRFGGGRAGIDSVVVVVTIAVGMAGLLGSLGFAVVTFLSSAFEYGPDETICDYMAEYQVRTDEYTSVLLRSYSEAVRRNRRVVRTNARRFRNSLASLLVGGVSFALGGAFLVLDVEPLVAVVVLVVTLLAAGRLFVFVFAEEYLTLDYQISNNE